ncbi:hypothetical protein ACIA5D_27390 [Actinoplanes sp. NPDC051513]|uniref:hypothetical protein n=1 Tax=Actinoplanes sp. NPDC051513 TaxID=3363908 RepID=UPI00379DFFF6
MSDQDVDAGSLPYAPPLAELATRPQAFQFQWNLLWAAFQLPNPAEFPPLILANDEDISTLSRYSATARRLASTTILNSAEKATITVTNTSAGQVVSTESVSSPHDATVGFSVTFRQLFANDERASFSTVRNLLGRRNHEISDELSAKRQGILQAWRSAHADLLNAPLKTIAVGRHHGAKTVTVGGGRKTPREIIEIFNYGELIHWDKHRDAFNELNDTEEHAALNRLEFLEAAAGLSHLYLGFSVIVDGILEASQPK